MHGAAEELTRYPAFATLLDHLRLDGTGPNLRVGGNSADESWWNPDGTDLNASCSSYSPVRYRAKLPTVRYRSLAPLFFFIIIVTLGAVFITLGAALLRWLW